MHPALIPQEVDGVVNATVLNNSKGLLVNNKDKYIVHHRSVLEKSLFGDCQKIITGTNRSIKVCQGLCMSTIGIPKYCHLLHTRTSRSSTRTSGS